MEYSIERLRDLDVESQNYKKLARANFGIDRALVREYNYRSQKLLDIKDLTPIRIPKGTVLWRCAPNFDVDDLRCFSARQCSDTDKVGLYFGTYVYVALAICVELKKNLKLGKFEVTEDIVVPYGKYAYRLLIPDEFRSTPEQDFPPSLRDSINISHFENRAIPIPDRFESTNGVQHGQVQVSVSLDFSNGEVFLSSTNGDLSKIKLVETWEVSDYKQLQKVLNGCKGTVDFFDVEFYKDVLK